MRGNGPGAPGFVYARAMISAERQLRELRRGVVDLVREEELLERLREGRPLRVKCGFDPTAPDLHLGHVVILTKMRQFQDFGHEVIFLIGDFTGMIGDPSGRSKARPTLTDDQLKENAATYAAQVHRVLDPDLTRVEFNSTWMNRLGAADLVRLAGQAHAGAHAGARRLQEAFRRGQSHRSARVHVSDRPGLRLGGA